MSTPVRDNYDPFAGDEISHTVPLTPEQEEIWLSVQYGGEPANLAYNEAITVSLSGSLDSEALKRALAALIQRHEALRCTLGGDGRQVCVLKRLTLPIDERDVSALAVAERSAAVAAAVRESVVKPFDLAWGPLVRVTVVHAAADEHVVIFAAHHIVCDGWSAGVIIADLGTLYAAERRGDAQRSLPAPAQLSDYARLRQAELSSPEMQSALEYWLGQYRVVPSPLELPIDLPRPPDREFDAARIDALLPAALVRQVKDSAAKSGVSIVAFLLAAFQAYLHRITGQRAITVAVPAAGQLVTGLNSLVGHCVRTLPVLVDVDPARPFSEFVLRSRTSLLDATEQSLVTFGQVVQHLTIPRDPARLPLVSVLFNVDPDAGTPAFDGLRVQVASVPRAFDNFEWYINVTVRGDDVTIESTYNTTLFEAAAISRRLQGFEAMLGSIVNDPRQTIGELAVMPESELRWLADTVNETAQPTTDATLVSLFLERVRSAPEQAAVTSGGATLTYDALNRASAAVAQQLIDAGVQPGQHVGVFLSRSVDLVVALLGVMRAGAAYLPLDPEYPAERIAFVAADAGITLCVTEPAHRDKLAADITPVLVDRMQHGQASLDHSTPAGAAYVIYTSGSTGRPKGVVVEHRNVTNFLTSMAGIVALNSSSTLVAITTPSFDISVLELFLPLTRGACVAVATEAEITDGAVLGALLDSSNASHFQATPAGYRVLLDAGWTGNKRLTALCGGEALTRDLAAELRSRVGRLWNCYGPTETTVWSAVDRVVDDVITIGRPIGNTRVYVLDAALRPVPTGVTGELFIGGHGVARGYWQRDDLNAERFLTDPFAPAGRMYRTGDLVRLRGDGRLEWIGRTDFQVKVRGHRIELGEIQARLADCEGVREAVVIVREDRPRDQRIVAYVRAAPGSELSEPTLRDAIRRVLPAYMVPQHIVTLTTFPLTPNGKVDRRALPAPQASSGRQFRAPVTPIAGRLAEEISLLVGVSPVGLDDDFFALGGHSLLALRLAGTIRSIWSVDLPLRAMFRTPTLQGMSEFIEGVLLLRTPAFVAAGTETDEFVL
jgi:amino acid adenylation domain-containing protein